MVYNRDEKKLAELKVEYQDILERLDQLEEKGIIGAFEKGTIIELSGDVIRKIAQKYENVQKGVGEIMRGALIETEARTILNKGRMEGWSEGLNEGRNEGINKAKKEMALKMLQDGELSINKIAKYSGLDIAEVEALSGLQAV